MDKIDRLSFKSWIIEKYPTLTSKTVATIVNEAFYLERHDLKITLGDILNGEKSRKDYIKALKVYLVNKGTSGNNRAFALAAHLEYLLIYLDEKTLDTYNLKSWSLRKGKKQKS